LTFAIGGIGIFFNPKVKAYPLFLSVAKPGFADKLSISQNPCNIAFAKDTNKSLN